MRGEDPATFIEGHDVEAELRALAGTDGQFTGASVYDQAYAILGLATPTEVCPTAPPAGWCRPSVTGATSPSPAHAPPQPARRTRTPAIALQALLAGGETEAAESAAAWILDWQADDGSISSFGAANANSTAVAAQALRAAGEDEAADRAADFVAGLQVDQPADAAGSIKFTADEAQGNAFATIQGMLAFGAPALDEIEAAGS